MKGFMILLTMFSILFPVNLIGGQQGILSCTDKSCGYSRSLTIGGPIRSPRVTVYCSRCKEFQSTELSSWKEYDNSAFTCPVCSGPVTSIRTGSEIPCPKCGKRTLSFKAKLYFD